MKLTLSWLKEHLETDADLATLTEAMTALGLEVDGVVDRGAALAPFTVAYVKSAEQHPNADKLKLCMVETAQGEIQVVCGAPNARTGMKGVFAPVGTHIPGTGIDLKPGVIRGVESNGMLCSERELGLSDDHEGIIDLERYDGGLEAPIGQPFAALIGADDPVIEIGLTPDRADCAGVRGIARDLAAKGLGRLKPLNAAPVAGRFRSPLSVRIDPDAAEAAACPLFVGRYIKGVRNGPSPRWLQDRLRAVGLRPISALVDITNFFTLDRARPLHVFDADKLDQGIIVRFARDGETLAALNDKTYTLADGMTAICDHRGVAGLGGVIGGEETGCTEATANVFVESALFDPRRTASTGRALQIDSDARYRFERGVDPESAQIGMEQATRMIVELCGGEPSELVAAGRVPEWRRTLQLRPSRVEHLGGLAVPRDRQVAILEALGCAVSDAPDGSLAVVPPSWRGDIEGEADLVEEVLRVEGFDAIPATPLPRLTAITRPAVDGRQRTTGVVRRALAVRGLDEAVTWSFMESGLAGWFGFQRDDLRLVNPIASDLDAMRPSLLANLAQAAGRNAARGLADVALFEVGPAYRDPSAKGQRMVAAGVRRGQARPRHWAEAARPVDIFDAKADAIAALEAAGAPVANLQTTVDAPDWYHPGRSGVLRLGPNVLAQFGELHPAAVQALDVAGPLVAFEVFLDAVPRPKKKGGPARPSLKLSPFQPVDRDFAFIVDTDITAESLLRAARGADKALIDDVVLFDSYQGKGVPEGKKSLAVTVTLQPIDATLTDEQIEAVSARIIAAAEKQTGATLRGAG